MAEKIYSSIIDAILDDREPDWEQVGLKDAVKSGEEVEDRTSQYVDGDFLDDIAGESKHTELPSNSKSAVLLNRMSEKESALPRLGVGQKPGTRIATHAEDYRNSRGDDESLFDEVTYDIESAGGKAGIGKRNQSDAEIIAYVKRLLNQGEAPAKIAARLEKIAEIELLDKKDNMGMNYLNENQGVLGMGYIEPNQFMDDASPAYERTAAAEKKEDKKRPFCTHCNKDVTPQERDAVALCPECKKPVFTMPKTGSMTSDGCVRQHNAWKAAGIQVRAASVKKIAACEGCAFFKEKACNLYHLPVVASAKELAAVINKLTAGVPAGSKRAALVALANRQPMRVETRTLSRPMMKTSAKTVESLRASREEPPSRFTLKIAEAMHKDGKTLDHIYKTGSLRVGSVEAGNVIKQFVASLRERGTKIALSQIDCKPLRQKLSMNNAIVGAVKCADCVYRSDMHCGLTGGTLVSFPGMEKTGKTAGEKPMDATRLLKDYELIERPEVGDIELSKDRDYDVEMGSAMSIGDL